MSDETEEQFKTKFPALLATNEMILTVYLKLETLPLIYAHSSKIYCIILRFKASTDETISCRQPFLIDDYMLSTIFCAINRTFTHRKFFCR